MALVPSAQACTSFLLRTSDGGVVYGRTMEFGFQLTSEAIVLPRQFAFSATGPGGKPGLVWTSKYGAVGLNAFGLPVLTDGMNEKGLAGGILYFPGYAGYANPVATDPAKALAPWEFLTWALTSFATVAEVKAALAGVAIIDVAQPNLGITPPFHYTLHDAGGASIVIEPVNGTLRVYDNPLGVMTNAPTFDWHLTNLKNYVKISPVNAEAITINGVTISSFGQGSGLLGIPGDPTPPSRFVRALGYAISAKKLPSGEQSVRLAEHILNNFDIPMGFIQQGKTDNSRAGIYPVVEHRRTHDQALLREDLRRPGAARHRPDELRSRRQDGRLRAAGAQSPAAAAQVRQAAVALRRAIAGSAVCCGSSIPSPACGGGTGRGHTDSVWKITPSRPHPNPPPQAGEGAHRVRGTAMNGKLIDAHCYFVAICGAPLRTTGWISLCSPQVLQDRGRSLHC